MVHNLRSLMTGILLFGAVAAGTAHASLITAIQLTGDAGAICKQGNCGSPDQLEYDAANSYTTTSVAPGTLVFDYTASSGDTYFISVGYSASNGPDGTALSADVSAFYIGSGTSVANDTFKIDALQGFYSSDPGTWNGLYTETVPVSIGGGVGAGSSVSANIFWDGQGVGLVGPFVGPGSYYGTAQNNLTGLTADLLSADFQFTFNFQAGTSSGAGAAVLASTPEPSETVPTICLFLIGAALFRVRRVNSGAILAGLKQRLIS